MHIILTYMHNMHTYAHYIDALFACSTLGCVYRGVVVQCRHLWKSVSALSYEKSCCYGAKKIN